MQVTAEQKKTIGAFRKVGDGQVIAGYASVAEVDREGDLVTLEAMRSGLPFFEVSPVVFWNHNINDKPIGKVISAKVDEKGLWVEVQLAHGHPEAEEVYNLIQQDILRNFSLHWYGDYHLEGETRVWDKMDILEISVVGIPGNEYARIVYKGLSLPEGDGLAPMIAACKLSTKGGVQAGPERDLAIAQVRLWYSEQQKSLPEGFGEKALDELEWQHGEREVFGDYLCEQNKAEASKRLKQVVDWAKHREGLELGDFPETMKRLLGELEQGEPAKAAVDTDAPPEGPRTLLDWYFTLKENN